MLSLRLLTLYLSFNFLNFLSNITFFSCARLISHYLHLRNKYGNKTPITPDYNFVATQIKF